MNKEGFKKISVTEEAKAFARPKKLGKNEAIAPEREKSENKPIKRHLEPADLGTSPWHSLSKFCNDSYEEFIPRSEEKQRNQRSVAQIHQKCVAVLKKAPSGNWDEIIEQNFEYKECRTADDFFYFISTRPGQKRSEADPPEEVLRRLKMNLSKFIELSEYAFTESENRDLIKLNQIVDLIKFYQRSERTFLFLSQLPTALDEKSRLILESSNGYQKILHWGASPFLSKFWKKLQEKLRLTADAINSEAAQNLAVELGETETHLRRDMELLKIENEELKNTLKEIRSGSEQSAVYKFAKILQDQPEPVLDQIVFLHQRLQKKSEEETPLSSSDSLSVLIALESLLKAFKALSINQFPANTSPSFELRSDRMGEYCYVEGSAFADSEDQKIVRCIRPGWRVGEIVVTPARVKEVTEEN